MNSIVEKSDTIPETIPDAIPDNTGQYRDILLTDLLRPTKLCSDIKELHSDIKEKFRQTIQNYLSPIPCFPSYYFFNCKQSEVNENYTKFVNEFTDLNVIEKCTTDVINCTTDDETVKCETTVSEVKNDKNDKISDDSCSNNNSMQTIKSTSKNEMLEESVSLSKSISSKVSYNALDMASDDTSSMPNLCANSKSDSSTTNTYLDTSSQPLFLRLSCSIKSKSSSKECSLNYLPTCLQEIISLMETDTSEIGLQDMRITLNLICLTQSNEIDSSLLPLLQKRESVISNDYNERDQISPEDLMNNNKLSDYQFDALNECVEKVNWLLEDEIASIALDSYPIRESTLEMVITHIENSPYSDFCFKKQVQLQFVFGSASNANHDISLNRFCDSMGQIKLPGFQLKREGKYYYISCDNEQTDLQNGAPKYLLNSLIPALSSNISFHFNDEADLRQICSHHILNDSPSVSHVCNDNKDKPILFSTPLSSNILKSGKETKKERDKETFSEDSFEDKDITQVRKRHQNKKNSKFRSASVPPSFSTELKVIPRKPGQSLPEADFEFIKEIKNQIKSEANEEELRETEKEMSTNLTENLSEKTIMNTIDKLSFDPNSCSETEGNQCSETIGTNIKRIQSNVEEDGYEGDSDSDSDIESLNWLAMDSKQPLVPKFWLIMKINSESVLLYFHTRPKDTSSESYIKGIEIFNHVVSLVESICKTVNQMLLLENLHDSRMCDDLLVPIEDNDPWNKTSRRTALSRSHLTQSSELETDLELINLKSALKLMKTNAAFSSGLFSCDIVWKKHFPLHPRLQSGPSRGILAMRTVLNSFSVNNRKNLFVYQESSGSVFYLRLYEIDCVLHNYNQEIKSLNCSRSPSESSLFYLQSNKKENIGDITDIRNKFDSNTSDKDKDNDSVSLTSHTSSHMRANSEKQLQHQCILLHVHGIREVSRDIKEDMVGALQKKLDEAVLDLLIIMLSRNPHSKLTPEDVSFIQKSNKEPTDTFQFIVDSQYSQYIHSIKVYLRQNLLTIMHNPKYTELQPEHHFKVNTSTESSLTNDFDTFLYYRQQASGSDSKGIACIILSLVDSNGDPIHHQTCPPQTHIGQMQLKTILAGSFDDVTKCERYNGSSSPETLALIQFHIWSVGKIDLQELSRKLEIAIKHAIWDLTLEFKLLRASLNDEFEFTSAISNTISVSEPSTPKHFVNTNRGRRTGRTMIESNQSNPLKRLEISRDISSSVPNILKSILDKTSLLTAENIFKYPDSSPKQVNNKNESKLQSEPQIDDYIEENDSEEMINLSCVLNLLIRPWLDYGRSLDVVSVVKQQYSVFLRHSIPQVTKEFKTYIQNMSSHTCCNAFKKTSDFIYSPCYNFEFPTDSEFESITNMIIFVRHEKLWRASTPNSSDATYLENFPQTRSERPKLRFLPHFCNMRGETIITEQNKPLLTVSTSSLNSNLSENKNPTSDPMTCIAPRQRFLLLYIEDKSITLYLYNWSNEYLTNICKNLSNIVSWHNSRGSFLQSVILQKAGIFHNQPFKRKTSNQFLSSLNNRPKLGSSSNLSQYFKNQKQRFNSFSASMNENVELLIKHHNPVSAAQEYSQNKKMFPQGSTSSNLSKVSRNCSNLTPLQATNLRLDNDLVSRFGQQIKLNESYNSKDLQELSKVWHIQGTKLHNPILDKIIKQVKRIGRLNHYCLTPLLFSPKWRFTVSPVRDHSLTLDVIEEDSKEMQITVNNQRLRYASGGYVQKTDNSEIGFNRSRRLSGPAVSGSAPKISADESWHFAVCTHYIQEYVQYLQTLGFGAIQMRSHRILPSPSKQKLAPTEEISNSGNKFNKPFPHRKFSSKGDNDRYYLIKSLLGGLLVFEVGFCEPYVYSHLYSFDLKRFETWSKSRKSNDTSPLSTFLDEVDKIKVTMHLHSFTYDFHLRTIHSYISGRQLIFRQGYHLTSFLDDFMKYYQKAPNYARNYVYSGQISIHNTSVPSHQLYNYIISHNEMYGMKVFRMNSAVSAEDDIELTNEYVLVDLSSHRVPYKDTNDVRQVDNFDVGVLITHDFSNNNSNINTLTLKFFVLLTSQRELFPKLFSSHFGASSKGSFKPIRLYSSQPSSSTHSRKSSTITDPNSEGSFTDSSLQSTKERTVSTSSAIISNSGPYERNSHNILKSLPMLSTSAGICDEEITYLGYFSSHETMMLQILQEKANDTENHLANAVKQAAIDCRRDYLWSCLLPRKNTNTDNEDIHLNIKEFNELLGLVNIIRLDQYDHHLLPFIGLHISWYQGLAKTLVNKYGITHRNFSSSDGKSIKLVFSHSTCLDCFMLLNINTDSALAGLNLVFKKHSINDNKDLETCSTQCHSLVEDFVNGCAYYMWSAIP